MIRLARRRSGLQRAKEQSPHGEIKNRKRLPCGGNPHPQIKHSAYPYSARTPSSTANSLSVSFLKTASAPTLFTVRSRAELVPQYSIPRIPRSNEPPQQRQ
ncbi:Protein HIR2 [Clarias magur]|uniref:Protein HIR2 n=1 Tax=Clarias magur TaxID=1594786 RepID=A0A8J4TW16_CLAMG|nr:Protein HIR2 [Clarias magur]